MWWLSIIKTHFQLWPRPQLTITWYLILNKFRSCTKGIGSDGHWLNDQAPLAVGGYSPNTNKAESLDIASNTWTEVDNYPYHDWYVFHIFQLEVWSMLNLILILVSSSMQQSQQVEEHFLLKVAQDGADWMICNQLDDIILQSSMVIKFMWLEEILQSKRLTVSLF